MKNIRKIKTIKLLTPKNLATIKGGGSVIATDDSNEIIITDDMVML